MLHTYTQLENQHTYTQHTYTQLENQHTYTQLENQHKVSTSSNIKVYLRVCRGPHLVFWGGVKRAPSSGTSSGAQVFANGR